MGSVHQPLDAGSRAGGVLSRLLDDVTGISGEYALYALNGCL
jgi:hypothetical protein